ncbi:hypothetical protein MMC07_000562 [Pseudocyphellaria aurata]|nr:hypothetical protein [Pseudocyphellaria aurata]
MALLLAKARHLKPEIKLAQALSEFEHVLPDDQRTKLRTYRGQSPPNSTDVMRLTAEIDRDASRNRKSRQCVGPRLTNVLNAVQQFSTVVDQIVGTSQSQIAGAIWGTLKISLQLASAFSSYFDQLSKLLMKIGTTSPRYQDFGVLYPDSKRLQSALCEYFVVIVRLCKQTVLFLKKSFWSQLSSSIIKPFGAEFGGFQQDLENLAATIREEGFLASTQAQQDEAKEMSRFRASAKNRSDTSARKIGKATREKKRRKARLRFLSACSTYNHEKTWKQERKKGTTTWMCDNEEYKQWKQEKVSSALWCTGKLGCGKTVLSANVVEDLKLTTPAPVAYFFCRHDEPDSLETRTIIGSIAGQIFDHIMSDHLVDAIAEMKSPDYIDTNQIMDYLQELLPVTSPQYFIIIDGLDECTEKEARLLLQCLEQLLMSKSNFQVYCSNRPDTFRWAQSRLSPHRELSMSQMSADIKEYIEDTLVMHLESGNLSVGDPTIILTIQNTLLEKAHGMFLWVVFQIDSICSQKTDEAILRALENLPKDLPDTFNRILRKLQHSDAADPQFSRKIFNMLAAAQRPLTLEELREAVSIRPGVTSWDASKIVNDMLRSLLDSCGSLVAIDEEYLTVHFAHHSVKQHLLSKPSCSEMMEYHVDIQEADLYLGDVTVTYLNLGGFDRQLAKAESTKTWQSRHFPSAILGGSLPRSNIANRLAVRLLKNREGPTLDIHSQLKVAAGIVDRSEDQHQLAHSFLQYAQDYWLFHTRAFRTTRVPGYHLWQCLIDENFDKIIDLPWAPENWHDLGDKYMTWIMQNEHWALIKQTVARIAVKEQVHPTNKHFLKFLEKKRENINAQDTDFEGTIFLASYLLSQGSDKDKGETSLKAAVRAGHEEMARLLLQNGVDVNAAGGKDGTALQVASFFGRQDMAKLLIENGADVNIESRNHHGTALQAASEGGHEDIVRLLLKNGANVNIENESFGSALRAASYRGHGQIASLLLEKDANVNTLNGHLGSALQTASHCGHEDIVRLLLENGANVNNQSEDCGTALQAASAYGHARIVSLLLEKGANVNIEIGYGGTALQAASEAGHENIVRLLLENGADVNIESGYPGPALRAASDKGHKDIVRLLLENGAEVNIESGYCGTALHAASANGHTQIVSLLLEKGANVNTLNGHFGTALQAASEGGHEDIAPSISENFESHLARSLAFESIHTAQRSDTGVLPSEREALMAAGRRTRKPELEAVLARGMGSERKKANWAHERIAFKGAACFSGRGSD